MSEELPHIDPEKGVRLMVRAAVSEYAEINLTESQVGQWPTSGQTVIDADHDYISVEVGDGTQDYFESNPIIDIDVFTYDNKARAKKLASAISLYFLRYPQSVMVEGRLFQVDVARCSVPKGMPWDDTKIRRISATLQLTVRR